MGKKSSWADMQFGASTELRETIGRLKALVGDELACTQDPIEPLPEGCEKNLPGECGRKALDKDIPLDDKQCALAGAEAHVNAMHATGLQALIDEVGGFLKDLKKAAEERRDHLVERAHKRKKTVSVLAAIVTDDGIHGQAVEVATGQKMGARRKLDSEEKALAKTLRQTSIPGA